MDSDSDDEEGFSDGEEQAEEFEVNFYYLLGISYWNVESIGCLGTFMST